MKAWFEEWFDSPFYFELYQNRSDSEAKLFIEGILHRISLDANASILDVCCGKGRHSKVLAAQGFQVTGIDISEQSIVEARNLKISNAEFILADARNFNLERQFDCSLNLFTSFGYFESIEEHEQMLSRIALHTKPGGYFILDFLNQGTVKESEPAEHTDSNQKRSYLVSKKKVGHRIEKEIVIKEGISKLKYKESVWLFSEEELRFMLSTANFEVQEVFGSYQFESYSVDSSPRCILFATRKA